MSGIERLIQSIKKTTNLVSKISGFFVPGAGLEPARLIQPMDFKSIMSTNSITRAIARRRPDSLPALPLVGSRLGTGDSPAVHFFSEASAGFEPANNGFANRPLKPLGYDATNCHILKK